MTARFAATYSSNWAALGLYMVNLQREGVTNSVLVVHLVRLGN